MIVVVNSGHRCRNHFPFKAGKTPGFSGQFDYAFYRNFNTFFFLRIGEVLDGINNLLNHCAGGRVDALLSSTTCKCREKCLLAPYRLLACALIAYVIAH
jgi:hypothetical protein